MNKINYDAIFEKVNKKLKSELSIWRYEHTISVMNLSVRLAKHYGADETVVKMAAIFHDYAKEYDKEKMLGLADKFGVAGRFDFIGLYHGVIARYIAETEYGIDNEDILNAIENHTLGRVDATLAEKILLVADTADPYRDEEGLDEIRDLFFEDINIAFVNCIKHKMEYNKSKGRAIEPVVYEIIEQIEKEI